MNGIGLIYGVDFSGDERNAGRLVWICRLATLGGTPLIDSCIQARQLPGSGPPRNACLPALFRFIAKHDSRAIFGLDFPFGLPAPVVDEADWGAFVRSFETTFTDCDSFRMRCLQKASGRELKRRTHLETQTPFSVYNLRLYRQTYFGIRDVIAPLLRAGAAWFPPMGHRLPGKPCVVEICPASTLKRGWWSGGKTGQYRERSIVHESAFWPQSHSETVGRDSWWEGLFSPAIDGSPKSTLNGSMSVYRVIPERSVPGTFSGW